MVGDDERLSRFVFDKRHFDVGRAQVKFRAFHDQDELSVLRSAGLSEFDIWTYGDTTATSTQRPEIFARGDFLASVLTGLSLGVRSDEPPKRHAVVVGWPTRDNKDARKQRAIDLAVKAILVVR